jgi:hypothetical protein
MAVGKRNLFDVSLEELDVLDTGFFLVFPSQRQHFVRHIKTIGSSRRPDASRG